MDISNLNPQIGDDGAVIGYRPKLEYKKEYNQKGYINENNNSSSTNTSGDITYSQTLNNFANNLPSTALENIDFALESMKTLIDNLAKSFNNGNWNEYNQISSLLTAIESNNVEYIQEFIDYHKGSITGDVIPEIIWSIYDTEQRLELLSETLKKLYYGDSTLTTEEVKDIDTSYLEDLKAYEVSDQAKVDYLALTYDSELNKSVSLYAFASNRQAISISNIINEENVSNTNENTKISLVQTLFDEACTELNSRIDRYEQQQSVEIMQKTLYNYYDKRLKFKDLYDLYAENIDQFTLMNKVYEYEQRVSDAIANINRNFIGNQTYLSEIAKIESQKNELRKIYSNINYNS